MIVSLWQTNFRNFNVTVVCIWLDFEHSHELCITSSSTAFHYWCRADRWWRMFLGSTLWGRRKREVSKKVMWVRAGRIRCTRLESAYTDSQGLMSMISELYDAIICSALSYALSVDMRHPDRSTPQKKKLPCMPRLEVHLRVLSGFGEYENSQKRTIVRPGPSPLGASSS